MTTQTASGSPVLAKTVIIAFLVAILIALFSGMAYMLKDRSDRRRTVRALTWRVGLQVALLGFLILAAVMGWITPHSVDGK